MKNEITEKNKNITLLANRRFLKRTYDSNDICNNNVVCNNNYSNNNYSNNNSNNMNNNFSKNINYSFNRISHSIIYIHLCIIFLFIYTHNI